MVLGLRHCARCRMELFARMRWHRCVQVLPPACPQVRTQFRKIFTQMGFTEMPTNNYVESR